jgi:hypothetical protein
MLVFPSSFFGISAKDVDIEQSTISGGVALSGDEDVIASDGGGRWFAEMENVALHTREKIMAWRAFKAATRGGVQPFVFPICDTRHGPFFGARGVPHSDKTSFADDTLYQGGLEGSVRLAAPLRETTLSINIVSLGRPLIGGERFSINHPTMRHRCYQIGTIASQTASQATFQFHPPLREAVSVGTPLDFKPRFVARIDGGMAAPMLNPRFAQGSLRLVEDFSGSYA